MKKLIATGILSLIALVTFGQETSQVTKVKAKHRTYYSDIIINATPEQVWEVLTDFESYSNWSHMFMDLKGDFKDQGNSTAYFQLNPKKEKVTEMEHVLTVIEGKEFSWSDPFMFGMTDYHRFRVEATEDGKTKFIQSDECKGGMTWILGGKVSKVEAEHYPKYNRALKAEVERRFNQ